MKEKEVQMKDEGKRGEMKGKGGERGKIVG